MHLSWEWRLPYEISIPWIYYSSAWFMSPSFLFIELFQWFLIVLSVLPSKTLAISAHLFSTYLCIRNRIHSSSLDQLTFLIFGFKWLCHLSRHYLPIREGRYSEIIVHFWAPIFSTSWTRTISSSSVQGALFWSSCPLWFSISSISSGFKLIKPPFKFGL